ncbi:hypothetical protein, partial [Escherichia coli]|uniref:hypothetical protein n=1 Tax=Escherichia coli TaxID=562 RepID=UPI001BFD4CF7
ADRNRSHWSTSKTPSYTKSVSWHHHHKVIERINKQMLIGKTPKTLADLFFIEQKRIERNNNG